MTLIADIFLIAGALGAAFYCLTLSRRLARFGSLEGGVGGAISTLSAQVGDMTKTLEQARMAAQESSQALEAATRRAEAAASRLELMLASLHDLPDPAPTASAMPKAQAANTVKGSAGPTFLRSPRSHLGGRSQ